MKRARATLLILASVALATTTGCITSASKGWAQMSAPLEQETAVEPAVNLGVTSDGAAAPARQDH